MRKPPRLRKTVEHPLARAVLRRASEAGLPSINRQVSATYRARGWSVCSKMRKSSSGRPRFFEHHVETQRIREHFEQSSDILVARGGRCSGAAVAANCARSRRSGGCTAPYGTSCGLLTGDSNRRAIGRKELGIKKFPLNFCHSKGRTHSGAHRERTKSGDGWRQRERRTGTDAGNVGVAMGSEPMSS